MHKFQVINMSLSIFPYPKPNNIMSLSELIKKSECYDAVVLGCNKYIAVYTNYKSHSSDKQNAKQKTPTCITANSKTLTNYVIQTYEIQSTYDNANAYLQPLQIFNIQNAVLSMEFDSKGMLYVVTEDQSMQNLQCLLFGGSDSKSNIAIHNTPQHIASHNKLKNTQFHTSPTTVKISATILNTQTKQPYNQITTTTKQHHKVCSDMLQSAALQTPTYDQNYDKASKQYTDTNNITDITAVLTSDRISIITSPSNTQNKIKNQHPVICNESECSESENNSNTQLNSQNKQSIQWRCPDVKNAACVITPEDAACYCAIDNFSYLLPSTTISLVKINTSSEGKNKTPRIEQKSSIYLPSCNMGRVLFFSPLQTTNPKKDFNIVVQCKDKLIALPDYRNTYQQITLKPECTNLFHKIKQGCASKSSTDIKQYIIPRCMMDNTTSPNMPTTESPHKSASKVTISDIAALETITSQTHIATLTTTNKPFAKKSSNSTPPATHNDDAIAAQGFKYTFGPLSTFNPLSLATNTSRNHQLTQHTQTTERRTKSRASKPMTRTNPTSLTPKLHTASANKTNTNQTNAASSARYFMIATVISSVIFIAFSVLVATAGVKIYTQQTNLKRRYRLKEMKKIDHKDRNSGGDGVDSDDSSQTLIPAEQNAANQNEPDTTVIQINDNDEAHSLLQPTGTNII